MRRRGQRLKAAKKKTSFRRSRWVKIALISIGSLVGLGFIAMYLVNSYLEGEDFRASSEEKLNEISPHIGVSIKDTLQVSGSNLVLPKFELQSKDKSQLISVEDISVDINRFALLDRLAHIEQLELKKLKINLDTSSLPPLDLSKKDSSDPSSYAPNKWQVDKVLSLDTSTQLTIGDKVYNYNNYKATATPLAQNNKSWRIDLTGGDIYTPLFLLEKARVREAKFIIKPESISLEKATLSLAPGEMTLNGLYKMKNKDWLVRLHAEDAPIAKLLDNNWKKRITGELDANLVFRGNDSRLNLLTGRVALLDAHAEALPILEEFKIGNSYPYRSLDFSRVSAEVQYPYHSDNQSISNAWLIKDIFIQADRKITVTGYLLIKENRGLGGTLRLGIPREIHERIPFFNLVINADIFSEQDRDGFCWAKVNMSGTLDSPREDLSARLKSVLSDQIAQTGKNITQIFGTVKESVLPSTDSESHDDTASDSRDTRSEEKNKPEKPGLIEQGIETSQDIITEGLNTIF